MEKEPATMSFKKGEIKQRERSLAKHQARVGKLLQVSGRKGQIKGSRT